MPCLGVGVRCTGYPATAFATELGPALRHSNRWYRLLAWAQSCQAIVAQVPRRPFVMTGRAAFGSLASSPHNHNPRRGLISLVRNALGFAKALGSDFRSMLEEEASIDGPAFLSDLREPVGTTAAWHDLPVSCETVWRSDLIGRKMSTTPSPNRQRGANPDRRPSAGVAEFTWRLGASMFLPMSLN